MPELIRNKKPLADRPLKTSQATGSALASMGIDNSIPLMHGSQGCGAFAKVFLIQHYREPMPIQNTAVDQIAAVMGADENIQQALKLLCEKHEPEAITLMTTGLTELQGCDLGRNVRDFYQNNPEYQNTRVIPVNTPDFVGSLQSGFADTIDAYVRTLNQGQTKGHRIENQVNVLCSSALTAADVELLKSYLESFGLEGIFVPDISTSLDGHLESDDYSATSTGGVTVEEISAMYKSAATFVIGESLFKTGTWLTHEYDIPCFKFPHLMGLQATDNFVYQLAQVSQSAVKPFINRARQRLQDALLDTHFVLSTANTAIAQESDLLLGYDALLHEAGCNVKTAVTATPSAHLKMANADRVIVGDHSDLEEGLGDIDFIIGNTHCAEFFSDKAPVLRAGLPSHDRYGASHLLQIGYEGARATLASLGNLMLDNHHDEVEPYYSPYRFSADQVTAA